MNDIKATFIWLLMISISLAMVLLAINGYSHQLLTIVLLVAAWFKGQLIIDHFMGLRHVERIWRLIVSLWLLIVTGIILAVYILA